MIWKVTSCSNFLTYLSNDRCSTFKRLECFWVYLMINSTMSKHPSRKLLLNIIWLTSKNFPYGDPENDILGPLEQFCVKFRFLQPFPFLQLCNLLLELRQYKNDSIASRNWRAFSLACTVWLKKRANFKTNKSIQVIEAVLHCLYSSTSDILKHVFRVQAI